jgi:hypothetical protein
VVVVVVVVLLLLAPLPLKLVRPACEEGGRGGEKRENVRVCL